MNDNWLSFWFRCCFGSVTASGSGLEVQQVCFSVAFTHYRMAKHNAEHRLC